MHDTNEAAAIRAVDNELRLLATMTPEPGTPARIDDTLELRTALARGPAGITEAQADLLLDIAYGESMASPATEDPDYQAAVLYLMGDLVLLECAA